MYGVCHSINIANDSGLGMIASDVFFERSARNGYCQPFLTAAGIHTYSGTRKIDTASQITPTAIKLNEIMRLAW